MGSTLDSKSSLFSARKGTPEEAGTKGKCASAWQFKVRVPKQAGRPVIPVRHRVRRMSLQPWVPEIDGLLLSPGSTDANGVNLSIFFFQSQFLRF